jgi:two-component system nitrogen regulation response regulator NtrX
MLGETDGYEILRRFSEKKTDARFILMTGYGSAAGALDATAFGAYDYLIKPFSVEDILHITSAVQERDRIRLQTESSEFLSPTVSGGYASEIPLIGKSP